MSEAIFRDYDAEELERQFNPLAYTANFEDIVNVGFERSAAYREIAKNPQYDIPYGQSDAEKLDLFLPDDPNRAAVEMYIHGGFWRSREKKRLQLHRRAHRRRRRDIGDRRLRAVPRRDSRRNRAPDACLRRLAVPQYRGTWRRPRPLAHHGAFRAGGHLSAMLLATDWTAYDLPADVLKSILLISGVFEIAPVMQTSVQEAVQLTPAIAKRNSPVFLPAQSKPSVAR